jgi:hypothetical protein
VAVWAELLYWAGQVLVQTPPMVDKASQNENNSVKHKIKTLSGLQRCHLLAWQAQ